MQKHMLFLLLSAFVFALVDSLNSGDPQAPIATTVFSAVTLIHAPAVAYNNPPAATTAWNYDIPGNKTSLGEVRVNNVSFALQLAKQDGTDGNRRITAACWYPVSGFYGPLARALIYLTFYFALLFFYFFPKRKILILGAVASGMTYSGTAALHGIVLVWSRSWLANTDFYAIFGILTFSVSIAVPLFIWSKPLEHLSGDGGDRIHEGMAGRTIILYWSGLIFVAILSQFIEIWRHHDFVNNPFPNVAALTASSTVYCTPPNAILNLSANQSVHWNETYVNADFVEVNKCGNPCQELIRYSITRDFDQLKPLTRKQIDHFIMVRALKDEDSVLGYQYYDSFLAFGSFIMVWFIVQAVMAVVFGRRKPYQLRNQAYWLMSGKNKFLNFFVKIIAYIAQYIALIGYLSIVISLLSSMAIIGATEYAMYEIAQADHLFQVDAWAPWCATGLVLFTALVYYLTPSFEELVTNAYVKVHTPILARKESKHEANSTPPSLEAGESPEKATIHEVPGSDSEAVPAAKRRDLTGFWDDLRNFWNDQRNFWNYPEIECEDRGHWFGSEHAGVQGDGGVVDGIFKGWRQKIREKERKELAKKRSSHQSQPSTVTA